MGILLAFFMVALPFDIAILYTSSRSPQEARSIAKNQLYYFMSKVSVFVVLVNTIATIAGASWAFYYLWEYDIGQTWEIFMYTLAISCLVSQTFQIGSVSTFYGFLSEL